MPPCTNVSKATEASMHHKIPKDYVEEPFMSTEAVDLSGYPLFPTPPPTRTPLSADSQAVLLALEQDFGIAPYYSALNTADQTSTSAGVNPQDSVFIPANPESTDPNPSFPQPQSSTSLSEVAVSIPHPNARSSSLRNRHLLLHTLAQALLILQLPGRSPVAVFQLHHYRPCFMDSRENSSVLHRTLQHNIHFSIRPRNGLGNAPVGALNDDRSKTRSTANSLERHFVFNAGMEKDADGAMADSSAPSERKRIKTESGGGIEGCQSAVSCKDLKFSPFRCSEAFPTPIDGRCWFAGVSAPQGGNIFERPETFFRDQQEPSSNPSEVRLHASTNWDTIITDTLIPLFFSMFLKSHENRVGIHSSDEVKSASASGYSATPINPKHRVSLAQKLSFELLRCLAHLSWCMEVVEIVEQAWHPCQSLDFSEREKGRKHFKGNPCGVQGAVLLMLPDAIVVEQTGEPWSSILYLVKPRGSEPEKSSRKTPEKGKSSAPAHDFSERSGKEGVVECSLGEVSCHLLGFSQSTTESTVAYGGGGIDGIVLRASGCGAENGQLQWKAFGGPLGAVKMAKGGVLSGKLKDFCDFIESS
ncbi:unnamed protein product [Phytomonas sp. EM1]|nr:unnamed protein product [Phytomonas sp. EM1]|eukprot:CCW60571.1 unnamed protein product [Phytomonas sp. isolate EM1]